MSVREEIIEILKKSGDWMTTHEINLKRRGCSSITGAELAMMLRADLVERKYEDSQNHYRLTKSV